jgi:NAD(P)-dependent dehydrogenase (short-subunit alcohol dehydrogenase family)
MKVSDRRFLGKTVVITGGGTGIGKATAERFSTEEANVVLVGRRENVLKQAVQKVDPSGKRASYLVADITKPQECEKAIMEILSKHGGIDVLVNNAGIDDGNVKFLDTRLDLWDRVMNTNLRGVFVLSQLAARDMKERRDGVIRHNASIDGLAAENGYVAYNCSKAALISLAKSMAIELAAHHIRVNCVSPGYTHTELTEKVTGPELLKYLDTTFERVPMGRMAQPDEVAAVFAFLASDDARFITGQNIIVDGGVTSNLYIIETMKQPS